MNANNAEAIRFWERRRIDYNLLLTFVFIFWLAMSWPLVRGPFHLLYLAQLAVLALIANLLYCAAYITEALLRGAAVTVRQRWRWAIWITGTLVAILLESYWVNDEIFPNLH